MNLKARRVEERGTFVFSLIRDYFGCLIFEVFSVSYERSEDRVICDNGFERNTTYWTFCYCFYSRILFNMQVSNIIHVVYR